MEITRKSESEQKYVIQKTRMFGSANTRLNARLGLQMGISELPNTPPRTDDQGFGQKLIFDIVAHQQLESRSSQGLRKQVR